MALYQNYGIIKLNIVIKSKTEKGKPVESQGRKATSLKQSAMTVGLPVKEN